MAQRDEREQQRRSTSRKARRAAQAVRKRRMLLRLVMAGGGFIAVLGLPVLIVLVAGTAFGGAAAEEQSAGGGACEPAPPLAESDGQTLPRTGDYAPTFMFDTGNIARVAADAGFTGEDLVTAVAVARAESGGNPSAINTENNNGSTDYGLWQINSVHVGSGFDPARYRDPAYNAMWAYRIYEGAGRRWSPWVAYNNGAYREDLPVARAAVEKLGPVAVDDLPSDRGGGLTDMEDCSSGTTAASGGTPSARAAISFARQQIGDPYVWSANGPDTWDCSSLLQAAWATAGVTLPRVSRDQFAAIKEVPQSDLQPGDLIFYGNPVIRHVAMYTGNGKIIEAPRTGLTVREIDVYWDDLHAIGRPPA